MIEGMHIPSITLMGVKLIPKVNLLIFINLNNGCCDIQIGFNRKMNIWAKMIE